MDPTKEQMAMIHNVCWKEINMLKINLDKFIRESEHCQKLLNELSSTDEATKIFRLIVFDRYMTQMVAALNMARKYNIHLHMHSLNQVVVNESSDCLDCTHVMRTRFLKNFIEWNKNCFENNLGLDREVNAYADRNKIAKHLAERIEDHVLYGHDKDKMKSLELNNHATKLKCASQSAEEMANKISALLNFSLPIKNLCNLESGFEFEAYIVHVRDYKMLEFFICLAEDYDTLYDLSINLNCKPIPPHCLPSDDAFFVLEERNANARKFLWRATIVPGSHKLIYLLDFGEVIQFADHIEFFEIPKRYKQIPPLAIKCKLEGVESSFLKCITDDRDKCKQLLEKNKFEKVCFRIVHQSNQVLTVVMLETPKTIKSSSAINTYSQRNYFLNCKTFENFDLNSSLNAEELQLPRSIAYDNRHAEESVLNTAVVGNTTRIIVTHVISPISFFGIIEKNDHKVFSWPDNQIFENQKEMSLPLQLNEVVLAQYIKDGFWYRAKVLDIDSQKYLYKVFYVDFGNTELVPLSSLAKCSKEQLKDPFRAILFHLSNLSIVSDEENILSSEKNNLKTALENIVVMILEQTINVEVVGSKKNDLVVRLIDSQYANIPKMLVDMGVAKEV